jgi:DNA polymerase alpha-associated DNA helicase A
MVDTTVHRFTEKMLSLLDLEREAELEESAMILSKYSLKELEKRDLAITKLFIKEVSTGIYGKILVTLERAKSAIEKDKEMDRESKTRKFTPGDIVGMFQGSNATEGSDRMEGIVYRSLENEVVIAFKEMYNFVRIVQFLLITYRKN